LVVLTLDTADYRRCCCSARSDTTSPFRPPRSGVSQDSPRPHMDVRPWTKGAVGRWAFRSLSGELRSGHLDARGWPRHTRTEQPMQYARRRLLLANLLRTLRRSTVSAQLRW